MRFETEFTRSVNTDEMQPEWTDQLIPRCSEHCPSFDGKRCELMGFRPDGICEPAVHEVSLRAGCAFDLAKMKQTSAVQAERNTDE